MKEALADLFTYFIIFATIWVVTFFIALPIGVKPGEDGIPKNPNMKKKALYSALVAALIAAISFFYFFGI